MGQRSTQTPSTLLLSAAVCGIVNPATRRTGQRPFQRPVMRSGSQADDIISGFYSPSRHCFGGIFARGRMHSDVGISQLRPRKKKKLPSLVLMRAASFLMMAREMFRRQQSTGSTIRTLQLCGWAELGLITRWKKCCRHLSSMETGRVRPSGTEWGRVGPSRLAG